MSRVYACRYVRGLSRHASRAAVLELLQGPALLDGLADELWRGATRLAEAAGATGGALHDRPRPPMACRGLRSTRHGLRPITFHGPRLAFHGLPRRRAPRQVSYLPMSPAFHGLPRR